MSKILSGILMLVLTASIYGGPLKVIFDTDMDSDVDDAGAMAVLHSLADQGEVDILGCAASSTHPAAVPMIDVLNTYFGRPDIPVAKAVPGAPSRTWIMEGTTVASEFPHDMTTADADGAVSLYRRLLAGQQDSSVVIITVGYLSNLEALLKSGADTYSSLAGSTLVARKVQRYVCMGSRYAPDSPLTGTSGNFRPDPEATDFVVNHWPTLIHFTGGGTFAWDAACGNGLKAVPTDNPVRRCYELGPGRDSDWDHHVADLITVLVAVRGEAPYMSLVTYGYNFIDDEGSNHWQTDYDNPLHRYTAAYEGSTGADNVHDILNVMLCHLPGSTAVADTGTVPDTLLGWWRFDDGGGMSAADAGWYGHDGTVSGCTWTTRAGNGALAFDGIDDYVDCGDPADGAYDFSSDDPFAVCAWVRVNDLPDREYEVLAKYAGGTSPGYVLQIRSSGLARVFLRDGSGSGADELVTVEGTTDLTDGTWHHVAGTADRNGSLRLYIDGAEEGTAQSLATLTGSVANSEPLYIGRRTSGDYLKGSIDDVRLYNYVLDAAQVRVLAEETTGVSTVGDYPRVPGGLPGVRFTCDGRPAPATGRGVYIVLRNGELRKELVTR